MSAEGIGSEIISAMDGEFHDSPDRVIAIIGGAYLDEMLNRLFRATLIDDQEDVDRLLRPDAALGSNGARYQLAYCLGLVTREQRHDMKLVAAIRNKFAHDFKLTGFDMEPVRGLCASLKQPEILASLAYQTLTADQAEIAAAYVRETNVTPRERYRTSVIHLFGSLYRRIEYVRRASKETWFSYDPDAAVGPNQSDSSPFPVCTGAGPR